MGIWLRQFFGKIAIYSDRFLFRSLFIQISLYSDLSLFRSLFIHIAIDSNHYLFRSLYIQFAINSDCRNRRMHSRIMGEDLLTVALLKASFTLSQPLLGVRKIGNIAVIQRKNWLVGFSSIFAKGEQN